LDVIKRISWCRSFSWLKINSPSTFNNNQKKKVELKISLVLKNVSFLGQHK
jgi:hypothetical protein